jgi:Cns1/TTC4 Wheel domain
VFFDYVEQRERQTAPALREDHEFGQYFDKVLRLPRASNLTLPGHMQSGEHSRKLTVYVQTRRLRILKVGKKMTVRQVIDQCAQAPGDGVEQDGLVLTDGALCLSVFVKGSPAEKSWIDSRKMIRELFPTQG